MTGEAHRIVTGAAARRLLFAAIVVLLSSGPALAQAPTATTAVVSGIVSDPSGAVVPGVTVLLTDIATNRSAEATTDSSGHYAFPGVAPGKYTVTASLTGFKQSRIPDISVEVAKAYTINMALTVGQLEDVVDVKAAAIDLQRVDATVGTTLQAETVLRLPNPTRDLTSIQFNQPLAVPYSGADASRARAGSFAGARSDQNTYTLDGADVTDNVVGTNFLETLPSAAIPLPTESVEEFRVGTTNPNATFARASGGQFVVVTKRGTNAFHGSTYWYHQDETLNANTWNRNRTNIKDPELRDNRYGFSLGGPLAKNRTFFFTNYEGRRFPRTTDITRIVPTASLQSGVMRFRDAAGNIVNYNIRDWDPRNIGLSPVIRDLFQTLPGGNDISQGDGFNTTGFSASPDTSINTDFVVLRLDHNLTGNWRVDGSYRYASIREFGAAQVDIGGILPGHQPGTAYGTEWLPREPRFVSAGVFGQLSNRLSNETRLGWVRGYLGFTRENPSAQVPSANAAVDVGGGLLDEPLDVVTGRSRSQASNSRTLQITDNANYLKGDHTLSFGGTFRRTWWTFSRNDLLAGPLTALTATVDDGSFITIPAQFRPPTCSGAITTNCLLSADVTRWNRLYTSLLGMVDNVGLLSVRNGALEPQPPGTFLDVETTQNGYEAYINDAWRLTSTLTLSAGANYQVYGSPKERDDRYAYLVDTATNEILGVDAYLDRARAAADQGQGFNPTLGYLPLADSGRGRFYDTDYSNFGPRVAIAWSPSFSSGIGKFLFGETQGVLRGGYSLVFDRQNNVNLGSWQMGVAFGQTLTINSPRCTLNGAPGANCNAAANDPSGSFRVGVDGPIPTPPPLPLTIPIVPSVPFGESVTRLVDPELKNGRTHSFTATIQRELPWNLIAETGYVLRLGRELNTGYVLNSVPYFMVDNISSQTFAQAYDAVAGQLRAGTAAGNVSPQPWFENVVGAGQTSTLAGLLTGDFIDGNVSNIWLTLNNNRAAAGRPSLANRQIQTLWMRGDGGKSFYQGMFVTVRKRLSQGVSFTANYTLSIAKDQIGVAQNTSTALSTAFDADVDYGPAQFDRRHVFNTTFVYDIPFGRDSTGLKSHLLGGWYLAGIVTGTSGVPLDVCQRAGAYGGGLTFVTCSGAIANGDVSTGVFHGVAGSNGIGTSGDPAAGGTGVNLFSSPEAAYRNYRYIRLAEDTRAGRGTLRGLPRWNTDLSVGKKISISSGVRGVFTAEVLNLFNNVQFNNGALNFTTPATFGVITQQGNTPRQVQLGFRVEF
jgi:carboxypeptidase family protein